MMKWGKNMKKFFVTAYQKDFKIIDDLIRYSNIVEPSVYYGEVCFITSVPDGICIEEFLSKFAEKVNYARISCKELHDIFEEKSAEKFAHSLMHSYSDAIMNLRDEYIKTLRKASKLMDIEFYEPWNFSTDMQRELVLLTNKAKEIQVYKKHLEGFRALMLEER